MRVRSEGGKCLGCGRCVCINENVVWWEREGIRVIGGGGRG